MNNKINLIGLIAVGLISLLFFIVPITPAFIISYIFTIIAIVILTRIFTTFKKNSGGIQLYANIVIACEYIVACLIFSVFANLFLSFNILWTIAIHFIILGVFSIGFLTISIGNDYITKLSNQKPTEERKKFLEEKKNYWK